MSERWMHRPHTVNVWEVRSALRWGSKHQAHVKTEADARAYAERDIAETNAGGRITHVERYSSGGVLYYDRYEDDS